MVAALAVVAMVEFASFPSAFNACVTNCTELLHPEVVVIGIDGGRFYVDIENGDVVSSLADKEACDVYRVDNMLYHCCAVEVFWEIVPVALDKAAEVSRRDDLCFDSVCNLSVVVACGCEREVAERHNEWRDRYLCGDKENCDGWGGPTCAFD